VNLIRREGFGKQVKGRDGPHIGRRRRERKGRGGSRDLGREVRSRGKSVADIRASLLMRSGVIPLAENGAEGVHLKKGGRTFSSRTTEHGSTGVTS